MGLGRFRAGPRISVDADRCELFGLCAQEVPDLFQLGRDGRLRYRRQVSAEELRRAASAARCCPMQAIQLRGGRHE